MLAHTGGAEALDAPTWLMAYGAAAVVLVVTAGLRGRIVVAAAQTGSEAAQQDTGEPAGDRDPAAARPQAPTPSTPVPYGRAAGTAGRVLGLGALGLVVAAALLGPDASGANLAPSAVLVVWWIGLPAACATAGDVMAWLDPFGTLARGVTRVRPRWAGRASGTTPLTPPGLVAVTAAASLLAFTWWAVAYQDGRDPRALGWFLVAYTAAATAGGVAWGPAWLRFGEGFGALSSCLAAARRPGRRSEVPAGLVGPVVAVWLGGLAFDLFRGTRAWVGLAGATTGSARTLLATACLAGAVVGAGALVAATVALARGRARPAGGADTVDRAVTGAWLATTAGAVVAHGLPLVLLGGQFVLALASDPFERGWDLFGTADRTIDYSPLSPTWVGLAQIVLATAGAAWGVTVAARALAGARPPGRDPRASLRVLWLTGGGCACTAAAVVALLSTNLE